MFYPTKLKYAQKYEEGYYEIQFKLKEILLSKDKKRSIGIHKTILEHRNQENRKNNQRECDQMAIDNLK